MNRFIGIEIEVVEDRLRKDKSMTKRIKLTVEDIIKLLSFVTKSTYFTFQGKLYRQIKGFAMGDPSLAIMSNFFIEELERKAIPSAPSKVGLTLWKIYVDDILEKIKKGKNTDHDGPPQHHRYHRKHQIHT